MRPRRGLEAVSQPVDGIAAVIVGEQAEMVQHPRPAAARVAIEMGGDDVPILLGAMGHVVEAGPFIDHVGHRLASFVAGES